MTNPGTVDAQPRIPRYDHRPHPSDRSTSDRLHLSGQCPSSLEGIALAFDCDGGGAFALFCLVCRCFDFGDLVTPQMLQDMKKGTKPNGGALSR